MGNKSRAIAGIALFFLLAVSPAAFAVEEIYRWVDENGTVHFGDSVPPKYAKNDRDIVSDQGVKLKTLRGERTAEERAAEERQAAIEKQKQDRIDAERQRDEVLLSTYLSVAEIEALRNRRKELLDGRIRVTEIYLSTLRDKLTKLQKDASRFQPYNTDPDARPIHENLARELSNTLNSIIVYEKTLAETHNQQTQMVAKFDSDIDRFRELKGLN